MHAYYQLSMICDVLRLSFWTSLSLLLAFKRSRCCHVTWLFVKILLLLLYFFSTVVVDHVKDLNAVSKFSPLCFATRLLNIYLYKYVFIYILKYILVFKPLRFIFNIKIYFICAAFKRRSYIFIYIFI